MKIKKIFEIELDEPSPHWLCADNLATALSNYYRGAEANFVVKELGRYPDYEDERIEHKNVWGGVRKTCSPENMSSFDEEQKAREKAGKVNCECYTWHGYRTEPPPSESKILYSGVMPIHPASNISDDLSEYTVVRTKDAPATGDETQVHQGAEKDYVYGSTGDKHE